MGVSESGPDEAGALICTSRRPCSFQDLLSVLL